MVARNGPGGTSGRGAGASSPSSFMARSSSFQASPKITVRDAPALASRCTHGFKVALEPVNPAVRVCPRIAQRLLLQGTDRGVVQWQNFQQARPGGNQQAD